MRKVLTAWMTIFVLLLPIVVQANSAPMKRGGTNFFNLVPYKDDNISVIHEDLTYDIKPIDREISRAVAEVAVKYTMKNSSSKKEKVVMSFPYESQYESNGNMLKPIITFNGMEVPVTDKGINNVEVHSHINDEEKTEQEFVEFNNRDTEQYNNKIISFDELIKAFNEEGSKEAEKTSKDEKDYYGGLRLMVFEVDFEPNSTNELKVSYEEYAGYIDKRFGPITLSTKYSFYYFLEPAKYWKSFGDLDITIKVPEGYSIEQEDLLEQKTLKNKDAYKLHFDSLPKNNLNFIVKPDKSDSLLSIAISKGIVSYFVFNVIVPCVILALTYILLKRYRNRRNSAKI